MPSVVLLLIVSKDAILCACVCVSESANQVPREDS